jgi:hypothetical protein
MQASIMLGFAFVVGSMGLTLAAYFMMRAIVGATSDPQAKDLASSIVSRNSALYGLIIALVFAHEMAGYQQLKLEGAVEANAIADVYFDAGRYGIADAKNIQDALFNYTHIVIEEEWRELGETGRLASSAWAQWDFAYNATLDLVVSSARQTDIRSHMLERLHVISETRIKRQSHGADSINGLFWFAAISGVVLVAVGYYTFPPRRNNLTLICVFGAFTGLILFFIYAFSNPYSAPGDLQPEAFQRLYEQLDRSRSPS